MPQQINLFQFVVKPVKRFLELKTLLMVWGIIAGVLLLFTGIELIQVYYHHYLVNTLVAQANQERENLTEIAKKYPENKFSTEVIDSSKIENCKTRFSNYLNGLAEAIVPGVWLTEIKVANNGKELVLLGRAYNAQEVEMYLNHLKNTSVFSKMNITLDTINNEPPVAVAPTTTNAMVQTPSAPKVNSLTFSIIGKSA